MLVDHNISIQGNSENTVLIVWPEQICAKQHQAISHYQQLLKQQLGHFLLETVSSYNSLLVYYRFELISYEQFSQQLLTVWQSVPDATVISAITAKNTIEIPVYYGTEAGWDLHYLSRELALSTDDIITLHANTIYHAYALGFTPGFCYLASLNPSLKVARRSTPRLKIPKGAVAIAEQQTAVYPSSSPAGWHIIGQTPTSMFDLSHDQFSPTISPGQQVIFRAISYDQYQALGGIVVLDQQCITG
jgi:KipI family sensor histidine kinase inhibitor